MVLGSIVRPVRRIIALTITTLMLAGCQAQASGQGADDVAIYAAVKSVMCVKSNEDGSASLSTLARRLEQYHPNSEGESASGAVEVSLQDYEDEGCPGKLTPRTPSS